MLTGVRWSADELPAARFGHNCPSLECVFPVMVVRGVGGGSSPSAPGNICALSRTCFSILLNFASNRSHCFPGTGCMADISFLFFVFLHLLYSNAKARTAKVKTPIILRLFSPREAF